MARHLFNLHEIKGIKFILLQCIAEDLGFRLEATVPSPATKGFSYEINCSKEEFETLIAMAKEETNIPSHPLNALDMPTPM
jgi:hypothetical protein